jgi:L-amino acid N-acyltransferase YncA
MNGWDFYQTKDLALVPYMRGTPVYKDGVLPYLYSRTKEEGKIGRVFHDDLFNMDAFVAHFEARKTVQLLCRVERDRELKPLGYCWVDAPSGVDGARGAVCAFCFFREATRYCMDLGRLGLAYWMMDLGIDILHGVILDWNTPAINYAKRLGFRHVASVPKWRYVNDRLTDVLVMQIEKTDYQPVFESWFALKGLMEKKNV